MEPLTWNMTLQKWVERQGFSSETMEALRVVSKYYTIRIGLILAMGFGLGTLYATLVLR